MSYIRSARALSAGGVETTSGASEAPTAGGAGAQPPVGARLPWDGGAGASPTGGARTSSAGGMEETPSEPTSQIRN